YVTEYWNNAATQATGTTVNITAGNLTGGINADLGADVGTPTGVAGVPGAGQVALTWTAPASPAGTITEYRIEYSSNGGSTWTVFTHAASTATTATVGGLTNGAPYVFRVSAVITGG